MSNPFSRLATAKAALLMTGSTYVSFFFGLIVSAVIARSIGPEDFGRYAYVVWLSGVLVQIANNGLNTTGIRFISESLGRGSQQGASDVHGWLLRRQYYCLMATVAGFLVSLPWNVPASWNANLVLFGGVVLVSLVTKALYLFGVSIAKGYGQYSIEAISNMSVSAVNMVCVLALYLMHAPLTAYLILFGVTSVAYGALTWRMLRVRKLNPTGLPLDASVAPRLKNHLVWTVVLTVAAALGNKASETYLLSNYAGPAEVGFFAIAAALTRGGVELLSAGLNTVLMPLMGHAYGAGGTVRVNAILGDSVRFYSFAGLLLAGVGFMWADVAIMLMYGAQYQAVTQVFQVMVLVAGITLSQGAFGALLSTTDHQRIRAFVAALSVGLSALAAVLLVPRYGLTGAVLAHALSSALIFLLIGVGIVKVFSVSLPWRELSRLTLAAVVATAAASACQWIGSNLALEFLAGLVYGLVFIGATFAFKAWKPADIASLMPLAERFPTVLGRLLPALSNWTRRQ
jgi:O-antigen/teichoic acid export membrane protein